MSFLSSVLTAMPALQLARLKEPPTRMHVAPELTMVAIADVEGLGPLFDPERDEAAVLFLHDPYCPISRRAHERVSAAGGMIYLVDVSRQHELNRAIEERTGVRHESPQAFVLYQGKPVWYASHGAITSEGLSMARGF